MKKTWKRLCTGFLALATVVTALPTTPVHAESKQYWTESAERVGIIEKVMNDGSIGSTFNEGYMKVEGETAYCIDINTDFKNGYKTRADASSRMSADQISDVALSIEYVKQYTDSHSGISKNHAYLLRQLVVWQRLSVHLGWQCDNVRASYDEIPKATQDEVFSGARAFVKENKGRYECGGYIYSGEGQELGQFWAKLNVGNAKLQKTSSNTSITDGNGNYSVAGATYGVFSDKDCTMERFGRIDILVNNAGTGAVAPAVDITDEQFNNELKIDLFGSFICAREYAKEMIKAHYGRIINIASMYGLVGNMAATYVPYHAAKGGVVNMTRALAAEWGKEGITVNSICPGYFITPLTKETLDSDWFTAYAKGAIPVGRYGNEGELDTCALFLASSASSYVNGQNIAVVLADTVISAFGMKPVLTTVDAVKAKYHLKTRVVGDSNKLGKIGEAVRDGFYAATSL